MRHKGWQAAREGMACIALGLYLLAHALPLVVVAGTALVGNGLVAICTGNGIEFVSVEDGAGSGIPVDPVSGDDGKQANGTHCAGCLAAGSKILPQALRTELCRFPQAAPYRIAAADEARPGIALSGPPIRAPPFPVS